MLGLWLLGGLKLGLRRGELGGLLLGAHLLASKWAELRLLLLLLLNGQVLLLLGQGGLQLLLLLELLLKLLLLLQLQAHWLVQWLGWDLLWLLLLGQSCLRLLLLACKLLLVELDLPVGRGQLGAQGLHLVLEVGCHQLARRVGRTGLQRGGGQLR